MATAPNSLRSDLRSTHAARHGRAFIPSMLNLQEEMPSPLPRLVLRGVLLLVGALLIWAYFGRLDVVAVAEGKLVPLTYLKIVQPANAGIVRKILVTEGQHVMAGQVLVIMDGNISEADSATLQNELQLKSLELRRVAAELAGRVLERKPGDSFELYQRIHSEYKSNVIALQDRLAAENANLEKAMHEFAATLEIQRKLEETLPTFRQQEAAFEKLGQVGFASNLMVLDKRRQRIENEQDLRALQFNAQSLQASVTQSEKRISQINSEYRQKLEAEQVQLYAEHQRLTQEWAKQSHINSLLELRSPQAGVVKDLATHTPGAVVSPGTVLMSLVPSNEALQAEVWLRNADSGFVRQGQDVKLKLAAYPFQKYGMIEGTVLQVSADSTERNSSGVTRAANEPVPSAQHSYRTLVQLQRQNLVVDQKTMKLTPGMQVAAEIKLSDQTVMEYILSPIRGAFHEAGREK